MIRTYPGSLDVSVGAVHPAGIVTSICDPALNVRPNGDVNVNVNGPTGEPAVTAVDGDTTIVPVPFTAGIEYTSNALLAGEVTNPDDAVTVNPEPSLFTCRSENVATPATNGFSTVPDNTAPAASGGLCNDNDTDAPADGPLDTTLL